MFAAEITANVAGNFRYRRRELNSPGAGRGNHIVPPAAVNGCGQDFHFGPFPIRTRLPEAERAHPEDEVTQPCGLTLKAQSV